MRVTDDDLKRMQGKGRELGALELEVRRDFARNYLRQQARGQETRLDPVLAAHSGLTKEKKEKP